MQRLLALAAAENSEPSPGVLIVVSADGIAVDGVLLGSSDMGTR